MVSDPLGLATDSDYYVFFYIILAANHPLICGWDNIFLLVGPAAPVAQRYHVTSDTVGREFDPGKRDFSHWNTKK